VNTRDKEMTPDINPMLMIESDVASQGGCHRPAKFAGTADDHPSFILK